MPPKAPPSPAPAPPSPSLQPMNKSSSYGESEETYHTFRRVSISVCIEGVAPGPDDWLFLTLFNGRIEIELKWRTGDEPQFLDSILPLDLKEQKDQLLITEKPLIFLLRAVVGKPSKEPDPLLHVDNRAGATVDMFPFLIGQEEIFLKVPLVFMDTGKPTECFVSIYAATSEPLEEPVNTIPLVITMVSAHCLPAAKDGTFYTGAICLDGTHNEGIVKFGLSLSSAKAQKSVWATASGAQQAGNTDLNVPNDDKFVPEDLSTSDTETCRSYYWNAVNRRRVDPDLLREWFSSPLVFELAGVPKAGKVDVRGRYMCFVDAGALLQPGIHGVTVCARALFYNEIKLPENVGGLLDLPPVSGRVTARETDLIFDEFQHSTYIVIRFDLWESLVPKVKMASLFETIALKPPDGPAVPIDQLEGQPPPEDLTIDVRKIRKEGGALTVHKELSGLACRGAVPMNQGIKRTAANRLLLRVRSMLKQFPPGNCSYVEWQDTVTGQHAASRRAVSSSFAPQPPPIRTPPRVAAARCRMAGDIRIANEHLKTASKNANSPRYLLCKAVRCLEDSHDMEANGYIEHALSEQPRNRFLLWIFGAQNFDKGDEAWEMAKAALRLSVKGDYSDGTANVIGWAALHTLFQWNEKPYAAFISATKMRKSFELRSEWSKFYDRWIEESGEEETFWTPTAVSSLNPLLIAAAFFLCLRCFKFCELILKCYERGCASTGSRLNIKSKICPDVYYLRAASLILRHRFDDALKVTADAFKRFGPSAILSQMRVTCLSCINGWDGECRIALECSERAGAAPCPSLLLKAALGGMNSNPEAALQRAARAHKVAPCGHSALVIARIYAKMNELGLAERWAAAAVKTEPLLADGWAVLALLAMYDKHLDRARSMLRTAKQTGPMSPDIEDEVNMTMEIVQLEALPEALVKDLCLCEQ